MARNQSKDIFKKYNPEDTVKRCPNGKTPLRKLLDAYAIAVVNLYGVISIEDFVKLFNKQNQEQTNADEVFTLLLPIIIKKSRSFLEVQYCFYKNNLVNYALTDDFDMADYVIKEQKEKPRFIPEKNQFLEYVDEYYEDDIQYDLWEKVLLFILKEWPDFRDIYMFYYKLKQCSQSFGQLKIHDLLREYELIFTSEKTVQPFLELIYAAHNNTRMWINNGHTPNELMQVKKAQFKANDQDQIFIREHRKIGPNEPCPCGSGKKYKKCCRLTEETKAAQLHWSECRLFYETWYGLMGFVNKKKNVLPVDIEPIYPNPINDEAIYHIREVLWKNPDLIDEYLISVSLPKEKIELLNSWRKYFIKGMFTVAEHKAEYSILLTADEKGEDKLYAVKGLSRSLANVLPYELPITIEAVLLSFKDKIVYDTLIGTRDIRYGKGAKDMFTRIYEKARENGIITCLSDEAVV